MLDPGALAQLHRFAEEVDRLAPGRLEGVYAVGSLALGDWRENLSNLDVVAVAGGGWGDGEVRAALPAASALRRPHRPAAVAWVGWEELAADPATVEATTTLGTAAAEAGSLVTPLTWQVVRTSAICTRGPEYPDIGVGELRTWARAELIERWPARVARWTARPGRLWLRRTVAGRVLEAARLWAAVGSGRALSKSEAVDALIEGSSPPQQRILRDSAGWRAGASTSMYWGPFERKQDAIGWLRATVEAAGRTDDTEEESWR